MKLKIELIGDQFVNEVGMIFGVMSEETFKSLPEAKKKHLDVPDWFRLGDNPSIPITVCNASRLKTNVIYLSQKAKETCYANKDELDI